MSGSAGWLACEQLSLLFELGLVDLAPGETLLQDIDRRPPASLPAKSGATKTAPRAMVAKAEEAHQDHDDGHETDERQQQDEGREEHSVMRPVPAIAGPLRTDET
jgi:hypothetical protein